MASVLAEVRWIRDRFNIGGNPVGDRRLSIKEVTDIYNNYRDDMSWMPRIVRSQYCALKDAAEAESKGKGKKKAKENTSAKQAQLARSKFRSLSKRIN